MPSCPLPRAAKRIVLRRLTVDDLADFQAYRRDPLVARFQGWDTTSDAEARAFLADVNGAELLQHGAWSQIAIAEKSGNKLIGDIGICLTAEGKEADLGFSLNRRAQGRGLAQEAVREAIKLVFEQTSAGRIVGITDARNVPSIRLMERLGLQKTEELETVFRGEACIECVFAISCEEATD